jgi:serine/threonine protein phosphatase PrpC
MPYFVQGVLDDHILTSATDTAKRAFSAAIEWHIVRGFGDVSISDGVGSYSIAEFASMMALQEIAESVESERASRS